MTGTETGGYTRGLAEFAHGMRLADVPAEVQHETLRILVDSLGCALAGLVTPAVQIAIDYAKDEHGPLEANVLAAGRASLVPAAFANAIAINAQDFDVYGPEAHLAPVAVAAALAVGDAMGASGADTLAALVAGLEVGGRIGAALRRPGREGAQMGYVRGQANLVFAAAVAAGRLLGLSRDQMQHAIGIAGYGASVPTMRKFLDTKDMPMVKYDHLGSATQNGIQAALLARRGFTGDLEVLEGENTGFWRFTGAPACDWDAFTTELGQRWIIPDVTYKHYPAVLYNNSIIHELQRLMREHQLTPEEIEHIEVRASRLEGPRPDHNPRHYLDAWHNPAYSVACGAYDVRPLRSWEEPRTFQRPDLLAFMERVSFARLREGEVTTQGSYFERWAPTRLTITARGETIEGGRDYHVPMDDAALSAKFQENASGLLTESDARDLERHAWALEKLDGTHPLTEILTRAQRPAGVL